jgi:REP element-mobilizing transposase RayT
MTNVALIAEATKFAKGISGSVKGIDMLEALFILQRVARKLRIQYPGALYHVMNRGDRREAIFEDDTDRRRFLETLAEACQKTGWRVHAFCLMSNHFHLVIETPQANLAAGMKWLLSTYTARFNRRHKEFGHLFSGRYKSLVVDGSGNGYLKTVCDYVHLNPARAKLLSPEQALKSFAWSSYPLYLKSPAGRPPWLGVERLFGEWGIPKDSEAGRRVFAQGMEKRRQEDLGEEFKAVERGWYLGDEEFRQELLEQVTAKPSFSHYGEIVQEAAEAQAERLIKSGLKRLKWTEKDLSARRKGDAGKVKLASELRSKTTMPLLWIANRLKMGSRGYLTWLLYRNGKVAES